ncbi:MAG TPA: PIN domain-containing protein, partial [Anaeromyxobacteraceae bacterium]|nr:PIN domain-containing protein [Anaeromyxobacteraceae bacterium]
QVWVSAALNPKGAPRAIVEAALSGRLRLVTSAYVRTDVLDVCSRPGVSERFRPGFDPAEWLELVETACADVVNEAEGPPLTSDPKDDPYLWTAWVGGASHLVSKDAHLLALKHYRGAQILDPVAFLKELRGTHGPKTGSGPVVAEPEVEFAASTRRRGKSLR